MVLFNSDLSIGMPPQAIDEYRKLKQVQAKRFQQHQQVAQQLQERQAQLNIRKGDMNVATRLMKVLDSRIPSSSRKVMMNELARSIGVDPKGDRYREVSQMMLGLDPDSMGSMRQTFASQLSNAQPGQIVELTRGVLRGDVEITAMADLLQQTQGEAEATAPPQPFQPGPGSVRSFEGQRTIPAGSEQASPQLVQALGLPKKSYRNQDLVDQGFTIPLDRKAQRELAESISTRSTGVSRTITEAAAMVSLFEGRPEVLGPAGGIARLFDSTVSQLQGFLNLADGGLNSETRQLARDTASSVGRLFETGGAAQDAARIESMVLGLAYRMAIARDIPGNRLTNAIIQQHLRQIGSSSSPGQFKAVLSDTVGSVLREFDETMRRQVGVSGFDIVTKQLSDDDIEQMANTDILPTEFYQSLLTEGKARNEGGRPDVEPSSPTIQEEQETLGKAELERRRTEIETERAKTELAYEGAERAERAETRAIEREERMLRNQEIDNQLQRERFEFQKQQALKAEQRSESDRIAKAFQQFGAAIAGRFRGARVGGGGISMGPGQDVRAFQIAPAPQRIPPRPPGR
jgi:hypothetical protein